MAIYATGLNPRISYFLRILAGIKINICAPTPPEYKTDLSCNVALARLFDPHINEDHAFIPLSKKAMKEAKAVCKNSHIPWDKTPVIAVYPSQELNYRPRWPIRDLISVIKGIRKNGFNGKIVVVGSETEGNEWEAIDKDNIVDANLAGKLSILATATLLKRCCLALCNDGGLMHIAGAVGCKLVGIMPKTLSSFRPTGKNTIMIQSGIACAPCGSDRPKNCMAPLCLDDIAVDEVLGECLSMLKPIKKKVANGC